MFYSNCCDEIQTRHIRKEILRYVGCDAHRQESENNTHKTLIQTEINYATNLSFNCFFFFQKN